MFQRNPKNNSNFWTLGTHDFILCTSGFPLRPPNVTLNGSLLGSLYVDVLRRKSATACRPTGSNREAIRASQIGCVDGGRQKERAGMDIDPAGIRGRAQKVDGKKESTAAAKEETAERIARVSALRIPSIHV